MEKTNKQERQAVKIPWKGETYSIIPNGALLLRMESRPHGQALIELLTSKRLIDAAWVIYNALLEAGVNQDSISQEQVVQAMIDDMEGYSNISLKICIEFTTPGGSVDDSKK